MALAAALTGCGRPTPETTTAVTPPSVTAPLATSIAAAGGTWATLPMGHLDDPLNTFWQLFYRPAGSSLWSDQVQATATATNGGLVLASASGRSLLVGVRPSNLLHDSPIIATSDGGRAWSDGLTSGLVARPAGLAAGESGQALALVASGSASTVEASPGDLFTWQKLTSLADLAAAPSAPSCDPVALGAVGYEAANPVIGARCARPGAVGLFTKRGVGWQRVGPVLPSSLAGAGIDVLSLEPTSGGLAAVLAASGASTTTLLVAWTGDGGLNWAVSPALQLSAGQQLRSIGPTGRGPAGGDGLFVLISSSSGSERLDVVDGPGAPWHSLAPPPAGTATVAFEPARTATGPVPAQALVAEDTVLTVWTLGAAASNWVKGQVLQVPIEFGSSG
jgi:hypothetical protein